MCRELEDYFTSDLIAEVVSRGAGDDLLERALVAATLRWYCKPCCARIQREWRQAHPSEDRAHCKRWREKNPDYYRDRYKNNPLKLREYTLLRKYGITIQEYDRLLQAQGGVCAICKKPETITNGGPRASRLAVDHDSATGIVRGLLCNACNTSIGKFEENPGFLQAAIEYLSRSSGTP